MRERARPWGSPCWVTLPLDSSSASGELTQHGGEGYQVLWLLADDSKSQDLWPDVWGPFPTTTPVPYLEPWSFLVAGVMVVLAVALSFLLRLNLHRAMCVSALRCLGQLLLLGLLLSLAVRYPHPWIVVLLVGSLIVVATAEVVSQPQYTYQGMFRDTLACTTLASCCVLLYTLVVVMHVRPWWAAQYLIPVVGMLLGQAIGGISTGLTAVMGELAAEGPSIEHQLALGATRFEAALPLIQRCMTASLTPVLTQMSLVGLASMPGVMSGVMLQGGSPMQAALYQICLTFLVFGTNTLGALLSILLAIRQAISAQHQYCPHVLKERHRDGGVYLWLPAQGRKLWSRVRAMGLRVGARCCGTLGPPWTRRYPWGNSWRTFPQGGMRSDRVWSFSTRGPWTPWEVGSQGDNLSSASMQLLREDGDEDEESEGQEDLPGWAMTPVIPYVAPWRSPV